MKNLIFNVFKDEDGVYCANCENAFIVTDGKDLQELLENIKEAVSLHLEDDLVEGIPSPLFTLTYSEQVHA